VAAIGSAHSTGFTLVEVAIVLVIAGLLVQIVAKGQELIHNARVRDIIAQQDAMEQAVLAFQDRFRALPGDYSEASANLGCEPSTCLNGNGNGRVDPGTNGAIHEDILAWQHLTAAGFLRGDYRMLAGATAPSAENTPSSVFGGYLQIAFDSTWGATTASGHNIKTGNYVPAAVLAEVDRKTDDGLPRSGRFQFSSYAGAGATPVAGTGGGCIDASSPAGVWLNDGDNCGAATLLR
jgi:prepilin-type N-terminal cleavage/methylation domain-containing protein